MLGNIWLTSALIVTAIFSASAVYKSYSDIQEAKQIQEHYQIISDIKTLLAKQYNKNPKDITRDEIIAELPKGGNWDKVLLLNRNNDSTISNEEFINADGKLVLNENEKIKLLALKAKLKNVTDLSGVLPIDNKYTFEVGKIEKNAVEKDKQIDKNILVAVNYLASQILYDNQDLDTTLTNTINDFTPYDSIYQDFGTTTDAELKLAKENYFKKRIKDKLGLNENSMETKLYYLLKDKL